MRWNSLATRLVVAFTALVLCATVLVAGFSVYRAQSALKDSLRSQGRLLLAAMRADVAPALAGRDYLYLREYVADLAKRQPMVSYAAVVNADGIYVAHSSRENEGRKAADADERARAAGADRTVPFRGEKVIEMASPVTAEGKTVGTVLFGMNQKDVDAALKSLAAGVALAGIIVLAAAVLGVRAFTAKITGGLDRLVETARETAAGDLRIRASEEGLDEMVELGRAFNTMTENLQKAVRHVQETGNRVGEFSVGINAVIQEQATNAAEQAASVSEVTATVEELSRTSRQISENANSVKEAAGHTMESAQGGTAIVRDAVAAMEEIKERVGDIARKTLFLGEKSHEIGKVMDIITEIASEIHLLALNAAIESAAAGEHGRRFSVVASEVRRLADKTRESTETIRSIISEIQSATNTSIQATEQGQHDVDRWRDMITRSAETFEEIIRMIEKTSEASMQISLATHQQTSANEQVVQAMHQIAEMVKLSAAHMKESSASATELKGMVGSLRELASVFKA